MDINDSKIQLVNAPCGHHGPYAFYKTLRYFHGGKFHYFSLGEFFFLRISKDAPVCIGELQLLWSDKNYEFDLASLKLYFLPEHTPGGRLHSHGKDEVLAVSEKIVLKLDDLRTWILTGYNDWTVGSEAVYDCDTQADVHNDSLTRKFNANNKGLGEQNLSNSEQCFTKRNSNAEQCRSNVVVLSYAQYCRLRGVLLRVEGLTDRWLKNALVQAIGGFTVKSPATRILFCKDTFENEELDDHEFRCDHLAPNLKGRPRKKKIHKDSCTDATDSSSGSSDITKMTQAHVKEVKSEGPVGGARQKGIRFRDKMKSQDDSTTVEKEFFASLHQFMKERNTPIGRIPCLGFKQIDLFFFYTYAQKLGGYEKITERRLWKHLYDKLGGNPSNTGAATCTRRHYERLLLPYEAFMNSKKEVVKVHAIKHGRGADTTGNNQDLLANNQRHFLVDNIKKSNNLLNDQVLAEKERIWNERRKRDMLEKSSQVHTQMFTSIHNQEQTPASSTGKIKGDVSSTGKIKEAPRYSPLEGLAALSQHPSSIPTNPFTAMQQVMHSNGKAGSLPFPTRPFMYQPPPSVVQRKRPQVYGPPDLDIEHLRSSKRAKASAIVHNSTNGHSSSIAKLSINLQDDQPQDLSMKPSKKKDPDYSENSCTEANRDQRTIGLNPTPMWRHEISNSNKVNSHHHRHGRDSMIPPAIKTYNELQQSRDAEIIRKIEEETREKAKLVADMTSTSAPHLQPHVHPAFMIRSPMVPPIMSPNLVSPVHMQQLYQAQMQANAAHAEALKKMMGSDPAGFQIPGSPFFVPHVSMLPQMHQERPTYIDPR